MVLSRRVRPYAPVALFPNGAPGKGRCRPSSSSRQRPCQQMAGPLRWGRGLSLPYEHEDRGADVRNQEKADERGGERKTEFEREQFGCIGVGVRCHGLQSPSLCRNRLPSESSRDRVASWMSGECARPHMPVGARSPWIFEIENSTAIIWRVRYRRDNNPDNPDGTFTEWTRVP